MSVVNLFFETIFLHLSAIQIALIPISAVAFLACILDSRYLNVAEPQNKPTGPTH